MALAVVVWMTWNMALPSGILSFKVLSSSESAQENKPAPLDIRVNMQVAFHSVLFV